MTHDSRDGGLRPVAKTSIASCRQRRKRNDGGLAWLCEPFDHARGEKALWVAVITQAMMDALSRSRNAEALYHKHEAINWLTGNSRDFIQVCLCAGLEPSCVRRNAKRAIAAPAPWRAAPGKGARYVERKAYRQRLRNEKRQTRLAARAQTAETPQAVADAVIAGPWT